MYKLLDVHGRVVKMKSGEPFIYTTLWTAELGKKYIRRKHKRLGRIKIIPA